MNSEIFLSATLLIAIALTGCSNSPDSNPADGIIIQKQAGTDSANAVSLLNTSNPILKSAPEPHLNLDSVELTALVRNAYEWHVTKYPGYGFPLKITNPTDSLFAGIDWAAYNKDDAAFKKTIFFLR